MTQPNERFIVHVTTAGERWDLLAWQYYGDATGYGPIIMANPNVAIVAQFDAGVTIAVPILEPSQIIISDLPPWKLARAVA